MEFIDMDGVFFPYDLYEYLFFRGQFDEYFPLDPFPAVFCFFFPAHRLDDLLRTGEQHGLIISYEMVAAGTFNVCNPAGKCEYIFIITIGQLCRDHTPSFDACFDHDRSITHTGHDTVTAGEIMFVGLNAGTELR